MGKYDTWYPTRKKLMEEEQVAQLAAACAPLLRHMGGVDFNTGVGKAKEIIADLVSMMTLDEFPGNQAHTGMITVTRSEQLPGRYLVSVDIGEIIFTPDPNQEE